MNLEFKVIIDSDVDLVVSLFHEVFERILSKSYYIWKYKKDNKYTSFCVYDDDVMVAHVGYKINMFIVGEREQLLASRHTSMVKDRYRGGGLYKDLIKFSIKELRKHRVSIILAWPNINNMKASLMHEDYFPLSQLTTLTLSSINKHPKRHDKDSFNKVTAQDLLSLDSYFDVKFIKIKKDFNYLKHRYLNHPTNSYYIHTYKNGNSIIIYRICNEYLNIVDFFSPPNCLLNHLEDFIASMNDFNFTIQVWCSIFEKERYSAFLRNGFIPQDPIFNCGYYPVSNITKETLLPHKFSFSMGDTDVF